ncbi:MAG: hypothetical protein C0434_10770 [Xanthomonadaceae bacterium]|nr:hypothetical protein [Xanthomonadaceae bacterium]
MTAAAISVIASGAARPAGRSQAGAAADGESAPFASLLGSAPNETTPTEAKAEAGTDEAAARDDTPHDAAATPQLPAWLLALRDPPPAVTDAMAGDPAADDGAIKGSTMLPSLGLGLDALRAPKGRPGDTPPTQAPPLPSADHGLPVIGTALAGDAAAGSLSLDALPAAAVTLDASQRAALDAALAGLDSGGAAATTSATAVITPERGAPVTASAAPTASDSAAASALGASLANQTDAYGEPLSLQGQDAGLRLGERLRWLRDSGIQEARLQLHPRELGSVDIRIRVEGQGASVWFGADLPGARAALEASLPQLRERLASEGLQLAQVSVGSQSRQQPGSGQQQAPGDDGARRTATADGRFGDRAGRAPAVAITAATPNLRASSGLVDRYA